MYTLDDIIKTLDRKNFSKEEVLKELVRLTPRGLFGRLLKSLEEEGILKTAASMQDYVIDEAFPIRKLLDTIEDFFRAFEKPGAAVFLEDYGTGKTTTMAFIKNIIDDARKDAKGFENRLELRKQRINKALEDIKKSKIEPGYKEKIEEFLRPVKEKLDDIHVLYVRHKGKLPAVRVVIIDEEDILKDAPLHELVREKLKELKLSGDYDDVAKELAIKLDGILLLIDEFDKRIIKFGNKYVDTDAHFLRLILREFDKYNKLAYLMIASNIPLNAEKKSLLNKVIDYVEKQLKREKSVSKTETRPEEFIILSLLTTTRIGLDRVKVDFNTIEELSKVFKSEYLIDERNEYVLRSLVRTILLWLAMYIYSDAYNEFSLFAGTFPSEILGMFRNKFGYALKDEFRGIESVVSRDEIDDKIVAHAILKALTLKYEVTERTIRSRVYKPVKNLLSKLKPIVRQIDGRYRLERLYSQIPEDIIRAKTYLEEYEREHKKEYLENALRAIFGHFENAELPDILSIEEIEKFLFDKAKKELVNTLSKYYIVIQSEKGLVNIGPFTVVPILRIDKIAKEVFKDARKAAFTSDRESALDKAIEAAEKKRNEIVKKVEKNPGKYFIFKTVFGKLSLEDLESKYTTLINDIRNVVRKAIEEALDTTNKIDTKNLAAEVSRKLEEYYGKKFAEGSLDRVIRDILSEELDTLKKEGEISDYDASGEIIKITIVDPKAAEREHIKARLEKAIKRFHNKKVINIQQQKLEHITLEEYKSLLEESLIKSLPADTYLVLSDKIVHKDEWRKYYSSKMKFVRASKLSDEDILKRRAKNAFDKAIEKGYATEESLKKVVLEAVREVLQVDDEKLINKIAEELFASFARGLHKTEKEGVVYYYTKKALEKESTPAILRKPTVETVDVVIRIGNETLFEGKLSKEDAERLKETIRSFLNSKSLISE